MKSENRLTEQLGWRVLRGVLVLGWLGAWLVGAHATAAQWVSNGPHGGIISAIAIDPQTPGTIYVGAEGVGVFKSSNGGVSWSAVNTGLSSQDPRALAIDPQTPATIYAGTSGSGVFKSSNGGESWSAVNTGLTESVVFALAIDPQTPATIYAGTSGGGVFKSSNGGGSWSVVNTRLTSQSVSALAIDPQTPATIYASTLGGVFRSSNGGWSWSAVNTGLTNSVVYALAIDPQAPATIYAGTSGGGGVFKSSNGGGSWSAVNTGLVSSTVRALAIDPQTPATIYAGTLGGGVFKSSNGGESWSAVSTGLTSSIVRALAIDPQTPATIYAGTWGGGVFKSSNGGGSWSAVNTGLTNSDVFALAIDPQTPAIIYAGTLGGGVFKSSNGGASWSAVNTGLANSSVFALAIDPQTPATIYAATNGGGVFKSSNGGGSWSAVNTGLANSNVRALAIDPQTPATIYAGTPVGSVFNGLFKSSNGGGSWSGVTTGVTYLDVRAVTIDPQTPATIYVGAQDHLLKSSDGGRSWSAVNTGLTNSDVYALAIDPQTPSTIYAGTFGGVFKSSDGGGSWMAINSGLTNLYVRALAVDPIDPSRIYAGTFYGGVFVYSGTSCNYSISPTSKSYSSNGIADDLVNVTPTSGCLWMATSSEPWIIVTSGSSGSGNGVVTYSVSPNPSPGSRTGTITIADQVFTVIQAGTNSSFFISAITPGSGPTTGGTAVTISGGGFQSGATVTLGGPASVSTVTSSQMTVTTGIASAPGVYDVMVTNPGGEFAVLEHGFTYVAGAVPDVDVLVPIVLSAVGLNGSFFTSEMTLTNRGVGNTTVEYTYTSSIGSGSGTATDNLGPGQQKIVTDAISYLSSLGIPIPPSGNQGGTLRVSFSGLTSPADGSVTVRTTTVVPEGRAGLAYAGIPVSMALTGPSYICGLRQNQADRSNVAIQNVGSSSDGNITLRLTVLSGEGNDSTPRALPDQVLAPGEWAQINGILTSNGLELSNGYVRVERINGAVPYYAYGVINDQANSDGSFIPPIPESALAGKTRMTLPVSVETELFSTELVLSNWSSAKKTLNCRYVADAIQAANHAASFTIELEAGQQLIQLGSVQWLRDRQVTGIGPKGPTYAGAMFISVEDGDLSGISVAARTSAAGGGGEYGLFYTALPEGTTSQNEAWLYGLQQNGENRSNLALVNTGEVDSSQVSFSIELYDGETGRLANTISGVNLAAGGWKQFNRILAEYAPHLQQGYAHVVRKGGNNPFIAYAVVNDGAQPGERSGDGAFISSMP